MQPARVLQTLSLQASGTREEVPESPVTGVDLKNGWYLVVANEFEPPLFNSKALANLSAGSELVVCMVEEHCMASFASGWQNGTQKWSVDHNGGDHGTSHMECDGSLPAAFAGIEQAKRAQQKQEAEDVDWVFDIPVELFRSFTGYRYDKMLEGLGDKPYEILNPIAGAPATSKPWWKVW